MSQYDFGNLESPLSGEEFINDNLEPWRDALHTCHAGGSQPSYAQPGTLWIKNDTTPWTVYVFSGSANIAVGTVNATTNTFIPSGAVLSLVAGTDISINSSDPLNPIVSFDGSTFTLDDDSVTNAKLANMAANTVKVNATTSSANPTDLALSNSQLLGRGTSGNNISAIALGTGLSMSGATLSALGGGVASHQTFTSSGTWTKPTSGLTANSLTLVEIWGGGGGGAAGGFEGGGGGGYTSGIFLTSSLSSSIAVTVGSGGAIDGVGGTSSFGTFLYAFGGGNGRDGSGGGGGSSLSAGSAGSGSGAVGGSPDGGDSTYRGSGESSRFGGGGGGYYGAFSGGSSFYGGGGGVSTSGTPGTSWFGGNGGALNVAGTAPGGGGGGYAAGARGECRVTTWY